MVTAFVNVLGYHESLWLVETQTVKLAVLAEESQARGLTCSVTQKELRPRDQSCECLSQITLWNVELPSWQSQKRSLNSG